MHFDWYPPKAESNLKKHRVSFEEAETVFGDLLAAIFSDDEHSFDEKREIIVGYSDQKRLLVVSFTERGEDLIRIISARIADPDERRKHENERDR